MNLNLTLIAQAVTFAVFIWFTVKFIWPWMLRKIEERQKTIADGLAAAEQGRRSLEVSTRQADEAIKEARARAAEIQQEVTRAREELRERVASLAVAGAEKILRREVDARAHGELLESIKRQL